MRDDDRESRRLIFRTKVVLVLELFEFCGSFRHFWTRPNDRMFMLARLRSQTHRDKLTDTSSKLSEQPNTEGKQTALTSHALSDKKNILRHIIQNRPLSGFDAQQCLTQTRAEDRSELYHNCSKQAQSPFKGSPTVSSVTVPCTCHEPSRLPECISSRCPMHHQCCSGTASLTQVRRLTQERQTTSLH